MATKISNRGYAADQCYQYIYFVSFPILCAFFVELWQLVDNNTTLLLREWILISATFEQMIRKFIMWSKIRLILMSNYFLIKNNIQITCLVSIELKSLLSPLSHHSRGKAVIFSSCFLTVIKDNTKTASNNIGNFPTRPLYELTWKADLMSYVVETLRLINKANLFFILIL